MIAFATNAKQLNEAKQIAQQKIISKKQFDDRIRDKRATIKRRELDRTTKK